MLDCRAQRSAFGIIKIYREYSNSSKHRHRSRYDWWPFIPVLDVNPAIPDTLVLMRAAAWTTVFFSILKARGIPVPLLVRPRQRGCSFRSEFLNDPDGKSPVRARAAVLSKLSQLLINSNGFLFV
jgi:hypothetical protein